MTTPRGMFGFDPSDPGFLPNPYPHYAKLREQGPLLRTEVGMWIATDHETCMAVVRGHRFGRPPETDPRNRSFPMMNPPEHTRLRAKVSRAFTPHMIEHMRPRIAEITDELIGDLKDEDDLVAALAYPLPVRVISEILGVPPQDRERFGGWSQALARGLDAELTGSEQALAERDRAREAFRGYFTELLAERRERPAGDMLSTLVQLDELTTDELLTTSSDLLVAGHETTVSLIGNGVLALARAGQSGYLARHPERAPAVVEEILRYDPPIQLIPRVALEDVELHGQVLRAGEPVLALVGSANRDPEVFDDPDRLDLTREPGRHLSFGLGVHYCLGAPLARMEAAIALTTLSAAAPDLALADPVPPYRENLFLRGLASLPVRRHGRAA
ncbi:cytochrome P450 [Nonomuraea bangladeshensis]|uniref:cytochrome P450 n=1 Tax=Nonomuraea bangladeshensis TaxID=404385 RepID=UPI003C2F6101